MMEALPRSGWVAVALTVAVLVGIATQNTTYPTGEQAVAYHALVTEAGSTVPYQIGPWQGRDVTVPTPAVVLLRPNLMMSRQYVNAETGRGFSFLLVQCADARDMEGHFPPVCYPHSGFEGGGARPVTIHAGDLVARGAEYEFAREYQNRRTEVTVMNFVLLPQGGFGDGMREVRRLAGTYTERFYGAAQIQLVFGPTWTERQREDVSP